MFHLLLKPVLPELDPHPPGQLNFSNYETAILNLKETRPYAHSVAERRSSYQAPG
jgi:hypothetical protein